MNIGKKDKFDELLKSKFDAVEAPKAPQWGELFGENFESELAKAALLENSALHSEKAAAKSLRPAKKIALFASLITVAALLAVAVIFKGQNRLDSEVEQIKTTTVISNNNKENSKTEIIEDKIEKVESVLVEAKNEYKRETVDNYNDVNNSVDNTDKTVKEVVVEQKAEEAKEKSTVVIEEKKSEKKETISQKDKDLAIIEANKVLLADNSIKNRKDRKNRLKIGAATAFTSRGVDLSFSKDLKERIDALEDVPPFDGSDSTDINTSNITSNMGLKSGDNAITKGGSPNITHYIPPTNFYDYQHKFPINFAFDLTYSLTDRLSLGSGINYSHLSSTAKTRGKNYFVLNQKLNYLGVPISLNYDIVKGRNLAFYSSAGILTEWIVANNSRASEYSNGKKILEGKYQQINCGALITSQIGLGVSCRFVGSSRLYAQPSLNILVDSNNNPISYKNDKTFSFSLKVGVALGI